MSRPVSMIVVQTRTSKRFSQKSTTTCSSRCSAIWPWAVATRASGTSSRVQARLNDRGADQNVEALLPEVDDDLLEPVLSHLAVGGGNPCLGHQLTDPGRGLLDGRHPVVDQEHLALAQQLAPDGGDDLLLSLIHIS